MGSVRQGQALLIIEPGDDRVDLRIEAIYAPQMGGHHFARRHFFSADQGGELCCTQEAKVIPAAAPTCSRIARGCLCSDWTGAAAQRSRDRRTATHPRQEGPPVMLRCRLVIHIFFDETRTTVEP